MKDNLGLKQAEDEASYTCLGLSRGRITGASSELQNFTLYSKTKRIKKKEKKITKKKRKLRKKEINNEKRKMHYKKRKINFKKR